MLNLRDHNGNWMRLERRGNFLRFTLECNMGITEFDAASTHVGKILELVVDKFFPAETSDDFKSQGS